MRIAMKAKFTLALGHFLLATTAALSTSCETGSADTGSADTGGSETETAGEDCGLADDETPGSGADLTIRVANDSSDPIWLVGGDCFDFARFLITVDGVEGVDHPDEGSACALILQTPACGPFGCEGDGQEDGAVRIGAGESYDFTWAPYFYPEVALPGSCNENAECSEGVTCRAGRSVAAGSQLGVAVDVRTGCQDGPCDCAAGQTCVLDGGYFSWGPSSQVSTSLTLDAGTDLVTLSYAG